jgi:hypothetical protein
VLYFGKADRDLQPLDEFTVDTRIPDLVEAGESFRLRGTGKEGEEVWAKDHQGIKPVRVQQQLQMKAYPLDEPDSPLKLEILYDGKPQVVIFRNGEFCVPAPAPSQRVEFRVRSTARAGKDRFGIVLKVNGESTIYRQRLPERLCVKWVLEPGDPPLPVHGFLAEGDAAHNKFKVIPRAAFDAKQMRYDRDLGTISLAVFRARKPKEGTPPRDSKGDAVLALAQAESPERPPPTLSALRERLKDGAWRTRVRGGEIVPHRLTAQEWEQPRGLRGGVITPGEQEPTKVQTVAFHSEEAPFLQVTIRYLRPDPKQPMP